MYRRSLGLRIVYQHGGWVLLLAGLLLLFFMLGSRGLNEPDEGRYASVAADMVLHDNWLIPHLDGAPHLTKPPLIYWLMALSIKALGMNEWAVRLPSALAALGVVIMTWSLARRWYGDRLALAAGVILLCSPFFFVMARLADPNMLLTGWVMLAIWAWEYWQEDGTRWRLGLFYVAAGGAMMTKGPVGVVLIACWIGPALRMRRRRGWAVRRWWSWTGGALSLILGGAWYVWLVSQRPELMDYFLRRELLDRVAGHGHRRHEPFYFYAAVIAGGFLPWLPWLYHGVRDWIRGFRNGPARIDTVVWAVALGFSFFTLVQSKLATYILPLFPWLAMLAATAVFSPAWTRKGRKRARWYVLLVPMLLPAFVCLAGIYEHDWHVPALVLTGVLSLFLACLWLARLRVAWMIKTVLIFGMNCMALLIILQRYETQLGHAGSARALITQVNNTLKNTKEPIFYQTIPKSWVFYEKRDYQLTRVSIVNKSGKLMPDEAGQMLAAMPAGSSLIIKRDHYAQNPAVFAGLQQVVALDSRYLVLRKVDEPGRL